MQTATAASFSRRAAAPSWPAYPAPQETFSDARYEVRFAQNAEKLDAVLKLRFKVFNLVMLDIAALDQPTFRMFFP